MSQSRRDRRLVGVARSRVEAQEPDVSDEQRTRWGLRHRDVRGPAQPAVHGRLRDARLRRRRGGRPAGDLAPLVGRRPRLGAGPARVPGPDHDAPGPDPAAHAAPAQGVVRRPWLPEPLLTAPDVAEDVELADTVSMAMLLVLETLTPTERAVFVLREVFALDYDEIAEAVDKTPAAVRQVAHRARAHVAARRPRVDVSPADDPSCAPGVPAGGRDRRPAGPARHPGAGRRPAGRRRRSRPGCPGARSSGRARWPAS